MRSQKGQPQSAKKKILLVDDSELSLQVEQAFLVREGFEVRIASNVAACDQILSAWSPDVVLTDVNMPDMSGSELCKAIKSRLNRLVPVVLFSSLPDAALELLAEKCGADGHLSKKRGLRQLADQVRELCESILW